MRHRRTLAGTGIVLLGVLAACTADSPAPDPTTAPGTVGVADAGDDGSTDGPTAAQDATSDSSGADAPVTDLAAVDDGSDDADLTCGEPPQNVLDWADVSIASFDGPVIGAVVVFAATTPTGDWYVLGIDKLYQTDAGETEPGEGARLLGLTNAVNPAPGDRSMIDLGRFELGQPAHATWGSVSWTGETLQDGIAAAERAVECLDEIAESAP